MRPTLPFVLALSLLSTSVRAQQYEHQAAWAAIGPSYGSAEFSCDGCNYRRALGTNSRRLGGSAITFQFGWAPSRFVRLGMAYDGWLNGVKQHDSLPELDYFNLIAAYSPLGGPGPFLEAGWGPARYGLQLGTGNLLNPVSQHDPFAQGWGQNYRLGVGWSGDHWAAEVMYLPGHQRTLWAGAAESTAVTTNFRERTIFIAAEARIGQYKRSTSYAQHDASRGMTALEVLGGVLLFVYSLARLPG
jgi:hypothetical protein